MRRLFLFACLSLNLQADHEFRLRPVAKPELISLRKAISLAEEKNLELKKMKAKVAEAASKVWLSATKLLPELTLESTHQVIGKPDLSRFGGVLTMPLLDAKAAVENKASRDLLESARLSANFALEQLIHRVASLYTEALLAKSVLGVAQEEHEKFLKEQGTIKRKADLGLARSLDVTNAEYQSHKSMSERILKEREYQRKLAELGNELALSDAFEIAMFSIESKSLLLDPETLVRLASDGLEIKSLQKELSSSQYTKASEAWGFLPTLKASLEGGFPWHATPKIFSTQVMLKLELPLFNGGSSLARWKGHQAQATIRELSLRQKEAEKRLSVYGALDEIKAYQSAKESSELAQNAALQAADSAERLFARGELTGLSLVDANVQLFSAKNDLVEARLKLMKSQLGLLFLAGRLRELVP